ncbi:hypothetical protein [Acinetobacter bereziniae]|uniref:hypothetical protein n=1 Tax=Acinetobacter bereziniae TaxID=106648 RepID=UPI000EF70697|nr:hypothetical protein [Acinetobacter bereziniae]
MNPFLSLIFTLAYFYVFFLGLLACFYLAHSYLESRHFLKAGSTSALAVLAIGGLLQAIMGG